MGSSRPRRLLIRCNFVHDIVHCQAPHLNKHFSRLLKLLLFPPQPDQLKALQVPACWSQWCLSSHHEHLPGSTAIRQSSGRTFPRARARPPHFLSHSVRLK